MRVYQIFLMFSLAAVFSCHSIERSPTKNKEEIKTIFRQFSSEEILFDPLLQPLSECCPNQTLSLIYLDNIPRSERLLKAHVSRTLIKEYKDTITKHIKARGQLDSDKGRKVLNSLKQIPDEHLIDVEVGNDAASLLIMPDLGYITGEKVECQIFSAKTAKIYYRGSFIPRPIHIVNEFISTDVELKTLLPNSYNVFIKRTKNDEKFIFSATSSGQYVEIPYTDKIQGISYSPQVVGNKGGLAVCAIKNSSDKKIEFTLPWGLDIFRYCQPDIVYSPEGPRMVSTTASQNQTMQRAIKAHEKMKQLLDQEQ